MPSRCQRGSKVPASRKAATLYLDEGIEIALLCERFTISKGAIWHAVYKLRRERGVAAP